jgi:acyl carrier protein
MNSRKNIKMEVIAIIEEILERENNTVTAEQTFDELQIDSILFIRLVVKCETHFGIHFEDEMLLISKFPEVGVFVEYIQLRYEEVE